MDHNVRKRAPWVPFAILFTGLLVLILAVSQSPISRANGRGFDGVHYYAVAAQIGRGDPVVEEAPFVYRLGTPLLASGLSRATGLDLVSSFRIVNLIAAVTFLALLYRYLRRTGSTPGWSFTLTTLALVTWAMPFRLVLFYPVLTDAVPLALLVATLLLLERLHSTAPTWLGVLTIAATVFVGSIFREQMLVIGIAASLELWSRSRRSSLAKAAMPVLASVAGIAITRVLAEPTGGYSFVRSAVGWFERRSIEEFLVSFYLSFGVITVLVILFAPQTGRWMRERPYRITIVVLTGAVAFIAGSDAERFLVSAAPILLAAIGKILSNYSWHRLGRTRTAISAGLGLLVVLLSQNFLLPVRDDMELSAMSVRMLITTRHAVPLLSVINSPTFAANYSAFMPPLFVKILLLEWLAVTGVAAVILRPAAWSRIAGHVRRNEALPSSAPPT